MTVKDKKYGEFVEYVASSESKDFESFIKRLYELNEQGIDVPALLTGGIGLASEGGEFNEIVKKTIFQGKPVNEENLHHMKLELGDICWYLMTACRALGCTLEEVVDMNVEKLKGRYPEGYDHWFSENRKEGDL